MSESLRSRTFGELFSQTFQVFFKCLGRLLAVQLVLWLPIMTFVGIGIALCLSLGFAESSHSDTLVGGILGALIVVAALAGFLLWPLQSALSMIVIADHILGQRTPIATAFAVAFRKVLGFVAIGLVYTLPWILPSMLVIAGIAAGKGGVLLVGIGVALMLVALVVSIMLFTTFFVAGPVLVLEQAGPGAAFRRSRELTRDHRLSILGLFMIISVLSGIAVGFLTTPLNIFSNLIVRSELVRLGGSLLANLIQQILNGAFSGVLTVLVYFDLRVKKDGFDIENLAELVDVIAAREGSPRATGEASKAPPPS